MSIDAFLSVCSDRGLRVHSETQTATGMVNGVAFRIVPAAETVEFSVNVAEKQLKKLQQRWAAQYPGLTAEHGDGCSVRVVCPSLCSWDGERLTAFLQTMAADTVSGASQSFNDRHERDGDPFVYYLTGFAGALLGALVGALPWFLIRTFAGYDLWILLGFIGIASFFGYRLLWGAHSTGFAVTVIVVCSLVSVVLLTCGFQIYEWWKIREILAEDSGLPQLLTMSFGKFLGFCLTQSGYVQELLYGCAWPLLLCALGLAGIRRQILIYTHESAFLRRGKRRR